MVANPHSLRSPRPSSALSPAIAMASLVLAIGGAFGYLYVQWGYSAASAVTVAISSGLAALIISLTGLIVRERHHRRRTSGLLRDIDDVVVLVQGKTVVEVLGPTQSVLGVDPADIEGLTLDEILPSPEQDRVEVAFLHALGRNDEPTVVASLPVGRDSTLTVADRFVDLFVRDESGDRSLRAFVVTIRDVTARAIAERQLREAAASDRETQLPNRARFLELIDFEIHRAKRSGAHVSVLVVGLDRHAMILDGFQESDVVEIMQEVARRIRNTVRVEDAVGRVAADQFGVLLGGLDSAIGRAFAIDVADRIVTSIVAPFHIANSRLELTVSVGAAHRGHGKAEHAPAELLGEAEESLRCVRLNANRWN